ncbi:helix-turn-helix domain-containing protein [Burkholderia multivorans]|uniref:helix-turn-helix domain-containing protein n=1 Tax=Burkholderia multivorans TaxID=87883 RepID=UPI0021C24423|nr:helix-turn-helix transcriptional regulator [Burkholderia multivorans]
MSQVDIARAVDCSQPTISEIQSGRLGKCRPSYRLASSLMKLYEEKVANALEQAEPLHAPAKEEA